MIKNYNLPIPRTQLSKENIQHFETWNFLIFLPSWNRVHWPFESGSDPDPQPCYPGNNSVCLDVRSAESVLAPAVVMLEALSSRTAVLDLYSPDYAALGLLVKSLRTILPCDTTIQSENDDTVKNLSFSSSGHWGGKFQILKMVSADRPECSFKEKCYRK